MTRINNEWEYIDKWDDEFLNNAKADEVVRIPHNIQEMPLHNSNNESYQKIVGYRKKLQITKKDGKRYFIKFEGVGHLAIVYFNKKEIFEHKNGYTAFEVEITDDITGNDEVVVKVDSRESLNIPPFGFVIDYLTYGGIYRDVHLLERSESYISDAFVYTPNLNTVCIEPTYDKLKKEEKIQIEVKDLNGNVIQSKESSTNETKVELHCSNVKPWSPESPNLYKVVVTSESMDTKEVQFGFRTMSFDENHFLLNGKPYFIRGLNRHQCYPYIGYAATKSLQVEDIDILKDELHVNSVRTSHYPDSQDFFEACDEKGLLVFTEFPGWQHLGDEEWKKQVLVNEEEMILQYRNHPCIYLWGVRINESVDDHDLYTQTNALAHKLDPTRSTGGVRYLEKSELLEDVYTFNDFSHSGKNAGCKKKEDVIKKEDLNHPLIISECNGHMFPTKAFDRLERLEEHALRHARVLNDAMKDNHHAGVYEWCMFDYATHKEFGSGDRICYHGVLDSFRNPKLAASVYASQGDEEPILEISSSMNIGDYDGGRLPQFYCFTNADCVKLYKNDIYVNTFYPHKRFSALKHGPILIDDMIGDLLKSQEHLEGKQEQLVHDALVSASVYGLEDMPLKDKLKLAWCMIHYKMKYEYGVELYGKYVGGWGGGSVTWKFEAIKNNEVVKTVSKSLNTDLHLEVKTTKTILEEGDVYDMASIRIRLLDKNNNVSNYTQLPIKIETSGPIELIGPDYITLEGGMGGTYIKTTGKQGVAKVILECPNCKSVTLEYEVKGEETV